MGLRNPFRIAFDPQTGEIWVGDVGSTVWEEVNVVSKGGNYQYPFVEGNEPTKRSRPEQLFGRETSPIYSYRHTAFERSVIGGIVYRGDRHPEFRGKYLFGDNYSGSLFALPATGDPVTQVEHVGQANQYAQRGITSFTQTPDGEILLTTMGSASSTSGEVVRLVRKSEARVAVSPAEVEQVALSDTEVQGLYSTNCTRCHGEAGQGDGPDVPHLGVAVPNFAATEFQASRSDEDLHAVIKDGGVARGMSPLMPPWGLALTDSEIRALVALIRAQGRSDAGR